MAVRYYDKVYVRTAGAQATSIAKASLTSGWTVIPGTIRVTQEVSLKTETDVSTAMGDGTDHIGSEAATAELQLINFTGGQLQSIRGALINKTVDLVIYDSNADTSGWAIWEIQLYPTPEIGGGKEAVLKLSGKVRYASDQSPKMVMVALT